MRPSFVVLTISAGLAFSAATAMAQTAEDGMAVVRPDATLSGKGKLTIRLACIETPSNASCAGNFELKLPGKDWTFAKGFFSEIESGKAEVVTVNVSAKARKHMRSRCSAKTRAVVTPIAESEGPVRTSADVDQRPVKVVRKSSDC